jgi:predicted nucleic acid-binding protein
VQRSVYLESSIISYLAARPSRDVVTLALQALTREWWQLQRRSYRLVTSGVVLDEIKSGDPDAASRRVELLKTVPLLDVSLVAIELGKRLVQEVPLPVRAGVDALHVAIAAFHGIDFLLTWNSRHIANATFRPRVEEVCRDAGYEPPVLCTPDELMEGAENA